ncbi:MULTISPECIES: protein kinase domain-containing protein [unclassified Streptomyces]|uniref:serine/threonine-protein kinase n=1 Tax=unclassified Streptomyces TaxID=2593676 RepID=UPI002DD93E6D|nr:MULTISPECIES: protein kinase [unclassified Streptomyces]WSA93463.1 protein kinase [Streptomyces sp. NBC_01795]WSB77832.1 protein kinase [Streptomyces sp. NBC_01775]WSS42734.1 protein kinase [Streptomyces sp. NBC_01187]
MTDLTSDDPAHVGPYRLLRRLGAGGMGRVYLARSSGGRTVAVKLVKGDLADDPLFRARFQLEVEAARRVGDRWTAPVLDADTEADTPWVATGYIAGPSLDEVVSAGTQSWTGTRRRSGYGPLPADSLRVLAYGLASALLDIHGAGLVHRDLKPSNVLLTIDGPRVIDFGIARALDAVPESTLTTAGMVVGSPSYMSPEQITGDPVTAASDVFCLGGVLAYAATGRPPFGSPSGAGGVHSVMFRIASEEPDLAGLDDEPEPGGSGDPRDPREPAGPRKAGDRAGPGSGMGPMRKLIADCLDKDPENRPAPEEVVERVQPIATGISAPPWLPAGLLAELGRHAAELLDAETPPSGSGRPGAPVLPTASPAPSAPGASPETAGQAEAPSESGTPSPSDSSLSSGTTAPEPATPTEVRRPDGDPASGSRPRRPRRVGRALLVAAGVVVLVGAGVAAGTGLGPLGDDEKKKESRSDSDVPPEYVGTWVGAVERDGRPTGQHRRFVITEGNEGEVVANSVSLGTDYECKSDGKLEGKAGSASGVGLRLNTKVVKSLPEGKCAAIGEHTLLAKPGDTLEWRAAGRTATLHKVASPEKIPQELVGKWQRQLANGGQQTLTIAADDIDGKGLSMISNGVERCEADADVFSVGTDTDPVRVAPPEVDRTVSRGACQAGNASTLRLDGETLRREFPDGGAVVYERAE